MLRVALRSAWTHKLRMVFTVIAIVLGVTFMTGTLILGDTIDKLFDDLFADGFDEVDVQVQGTEVFDGGDGFSSPRHPLALDMLDQVEAIDGVEAADPFVQIQAAGASHQVLGPDGETLGSSMGPPTLLESWMENLSPYSIEDGEAPSADDEVAINVAAAENSELELGDELTVISQLGTDTYTLVGTFRFGTAGSAGGATSIAFTFDELQRLAEMDGMTQVIQIRGDGSLSDAELAAAIDATMPETAEAITGQEAADQISDAVSSGFQFIQILILVFVAIAVIVGAFIIYNTFAILVAQRTRELALLRAVGASRRQVFVSVVFEAAITGLVASLLGLVLGYLLASGILSVLSSGGLDVPTTTLVVNAPTIVFAFLVGLGLTVVLSLMPARSATQVPPLAALRDVAIDRSGASRVRIGIGVALLVLAVLGMLSGEPGGVGAGSAALIIGAIVIGPALAGPTVKAIGVPLRAMGVTGRIATENAARSPKRTAATASALIIGVALVGFILIFGESARTSITSEVERGFTGDLIVQAEGAAGGFMPGSIPPTVADTVAGVEGVDEITAAAFTQAQLVFDDGEESVEFVSALNPATASRFFQPAMTEGELDDLTPEGIIVDTGIADDRSLAVGDTVAITGTNGVTRDLVVQAISDDLTFIGMWAIDMDTYDELVVNPQLVQVYASVDDGATVETVKAAVADAVADSPAVEVLDRDEWVGDLAAQITGLLTFITALLAMSVIIAAIGIINTLLLSIHERIRELGLLRAVGMTRGQVFRSMTIEAILIALLGTVIGLVIGLVASRALVASLDDFGLSSFAVPAGSMVTVVIGGALLGTVAAAYPAWRATRIKMLDAISED